MSNITLDDRDLAVLATIRRERATVETLAEALQYPPDDLRERLAELEDNDLLRPAGSDSDSGFGSDSDPNFANAEEYELTPSGMRVLATSRPGSSDERIDTPAPVQRRLEASDLRPDEEDAVRGAFAFLRYWGEATDAEIVDGVHSEQPAGYPSGKRWWNDLVRDVLADLPGVENPDGADAGGRWRYRESASDDASREGLRSPSCNEEGDG